MSMTCKCNNAIQHPTKPHSCSNPQVQSSPDNSSQSILESGVWSLKFGNEKSMKYSAAILNH